MYFECNIEVLLHLLLIIPTLNTSLRLIRLETCSLTLIVTLQPLLYLCMLKDTYVSTKFEIISILNLKVC